MTETIDEMTKNIWVEFDPTIKRTVPRGGIFEGHIMFDLIDTHGLPMEIAIDRIYEDDVRIDWVGFIQKGWERGWYSYQIFDKIKFGLSESFTFQNDKASIEEILNRVRLFIILNDEDYKDVK